MNSEFLDIMCVFSFKPRVLEIKNQHLKDIDADFKCFDDRLL